MIRHKHTKHNMFNVYYGIILYLTMYIVYVGCLLSASFEYNKLISILHRRCLIILQVLQPSYLNLKLKTVKLTYTDTQVSTKIIYFIIFIGKNNNITISIINVTSS